MIKPTRPDRPEPQRPTTIALTPNVRLFGGWGPRL
jgi:hypothetical protein